VYLVGLTQLLVPILGATLIGAGLAGLEVEWLALFRKPLPGALAHILAWLRASGLQLYNRLAHPWVPLWQFPVMAVATAFCALGIHRFLARSRPA
jgi:hypothetical protein